MALFSFRTRNPDRDRGTDLARAGRFSNLLQELQRDIERERAGLHDRYERVTMRAAFSQQALENERVGPEISSTIDELTETMIRYTERMASLQRQIDLVAEMRGHVGRFVEESQGSADQPASSDARRG